MRIALITTSFLPRIGGAEFAIDHLARQWSRQGHEVCVFNTASANAPAGKREYAVRRYGYPRGGHRFGAHRFPFRGQGARRLRKLIDSYRPDFISAHFGYPVAMWLSRIRPVPRFLITCHGPALNVAPSGPRRKFGIDAEIASALNTAKRVVALSRHARSVMEGMGVEPSRIVDIPNGVETARFSRPVDFDLRGRFNLSPDAVVVLSVGRESWSKDYRTGIRAFSRAASGAPDVFYVVVGKGVGKWQSLKSDVAAGDRVVFCEGLYGDDLVGTYQQADVFLLSSIKETFPLVVVEAMAAGLPQVVTDVSGSQDAIRDGINGLVVPPGDLEAMATALRTLVRDNALRKRFAMANRERAWHYDWERVSRMYLEHA